jgi:hypothetical protein
MTPFAPRVLDLGLRTGRTAYEARDRGTAGAAVLFRVCGWIYGVRAAGGAICRVVHCCRGQAGEIEVFVRALSQDGWKSCARVFAVMIRRGGLVRFCRLCGLTKWQNEVS